MKKTVWSGPDAFPDFTRISMKIFRAAVLAFCFCALCFSGAGCQVKARGQARTDIGVYS